MGAADEHAVPVAIEQVVAGLEEMETVLGAAARPALGAVRDGLAQAMAARDRGDSDLAFERIGDAMRRLASAASVLDPAEAALMRAVAERFRALLCRRDTAGARRQADEMFLRSGAVERKGAPEK